MADDREIIEIKDEFVKFDYSPILQQGIIIIGDKEYRLPIYQFKMLCNDIVGEEHRRNYYQKVEEKANLAEKFAEALSEIAKNISISIRR